MHKLRPMPAQPELTLHALPPSHPCMTAEAGLKLKGLAYERVDFQPGPHVEEMTQRYGEGNTTVPGLMVDDEPVHGSRPILDRSSSSRPSRRSSPTGTPTRSARPSAGATRSSRTSAGG